MTVLPLFCFPRLSWFKELQGENVVIDVHENYVKQTYRNRFEILGPNGVQRLTIPVAGTKGIKTPIQEMLLAPGKWQREHLHSLRTAYSTAPFFEHYFDELSALFKSPPETLSAFNLNALNWAVDALGFEKNWNLSEAYVSEGADVDFRMDGDQRDEAQTAYLQVFSDRYEFKADLSVVDLIFNKGPEGVLFIED